MTLNELIVRYDAEYEFLRQLTIPEEERALYTTAKWSGEYRWFLSPNVICIEKARLFRRND